MEDRSQDIRLTIDRGTIVIPAWVGGLLTLAFLFSALALLLLWNSNQKTERELRILQLHTADIENVLIRQDVATRDDFASWGENGPPNAPDKRQTEPRKEQ